MSVNKYMHPRNIYKNPPDFKQLALEYPEFRQFVKQELSGKITFDFKDKNALRALSYTLLEKDFGLDVNIPLNKLIPTIPLRLNYILWLEDLLSLYEKSETIKGIDIGTGASCIYPLLGAKKNGWFFLGTEINNESISDAQNNVLRNNLQNNIKVIKVHENDVLKSLLGDELYDFSMCNPPFFGSTQELHPHFKARKPDRPKPKNSFCASVTEVVVSGGEVDFISKLINESKETGRQVKIYTTMLGHKKSLPLLKSHLRQVCVSSFKETEFCQGNTTRWGLAWTFCDEIDLKKCPEPIKQLMKKSKSKDPLICKIPNNNNAMEYFDTVSKDIIKLFKILKMSVEDISKSKNSSKYLIRAFSNTWSNQRKKRRENLKAQQNHSSGEQEVISCMEENNCETSVKSPHKREHEDYLDGNVIKRMKISDTSILVDFFKFTLTIKCDDSMIIFELDCSSDSNREYLHQILQYVKNHLHIQ